MEQDEYRADDYEEYCSDFSDEDFTQEELDEKNALTTIFHLQSWMNTLIEHSPELDVIKIMSNFDKRGKGVI